MKAKKIITFFLLLSIITLVSCSKSEENVPLLGSIEELILTSNSTDAILAIDETVNFTIVSDEGIDYTDQATFYVNQTEISGASYTFNEQGNYSVNAIFAGVTSNSLNFDVVTERTVLIDNNKVFRNQSVNFSLVDTDGTDVTAEATFYVNNNVISGTQFSSATEGNFEVYATYELAGSTLTTQTKEFVVFVPKRKVVIEDYTGTWCGYCPSVAAAIVNTHNVTSDIAVVAIHETANSSPDPYHFPQVQLLKDEFGVDGLPAARINRTTQWNMPYSTSDVTNIAGEETNLAIAINSQLTGNSFTVQVKTVFETGSIAGDKLVVYLVENGIIYQQTNYYNTDPTSPYFGLGNPIPNFEHNEVLRQSLSGIFGDNISATAAYEVNTKNFTTTIPADYNANNLQIVAMVVSADNSARNAQFADVNENKGYE
jgi:thiol-disulfide isomerase/thioredoxin